MKRLLVLASVRFLLRHPLQMGLTVLGVALGVGVVVSMDLAIQSSREAFRVSTETVAGRATHRVTGVNSRLPDSLFTRLRVDLGVRPSAPVLEAFVSSPELPGRPLLALGIDPFSEGAFRPFLLGGDSELDVAALVAVPGAAVLGRSLAEAAGVRVGDHLSVQVDGRTRKLLVEGILEPADEMSRRALSDLLVMDLSTAQELLSLGGRISRIDLILPRGSDGDSVAEDLRARLGASVEITEVGTRTAELSRMTRAFDLNLTALSLLALIFGMFLIYNTMTFSVVQRRPILGELRALGVTRREITGVVLGEAGLVGVVGTGLGLFMGVAMGRGLVELVTQTINDLYFVLSVQGLYLSPLALVKGAILGVAATILAAVPPSLEAAMAPPRSTMVRSLLEEKARRAVPRAGVVGAGFLAMGGAILLVPSRSLVLSFAGLFGVVMGIAFLTPLTTSFLMGMLAPIARRSLGILGAMAARGVVAATSRTAPAMAALVVAVSVTVGLGTMISSFRGTVSSWLDGTLQADIYVSLPGLVSSRAQGTLEPELVRRLTANPDLAGFSTYREATGVVEGSQIRLVALDLDPRGEKAFQFKAGGGRSAFESFREEDGVFLSEPLAYRRDLGLGDGIRLLTGNGSREFKVAGIFFDYGSDQGVVMMARSTYDRYWSDPGVTSLGLFLHDNTSADRVVADLQEAVGEGQAVLIRSNRSLKAASLEVFDRTFAITGVLRGLAFTVAFIGVLSALMALQLDKSRELGVLRANGLTPLQVWQLVMAQTGLMGLVAGLLAIPAGLAMAAVMIFVVNKRSFGWSLRLEVGPELLVQAVLLALLGALLAGVYPALRMSRTSPAEALRQE